MHTHILIAALALAAPQSDTIIPVETGTRLEVDNFRGEVVVEGWDRDEVRITSDLSGQQRLDAGLAGSRVRVRARTVNGGPRSADFAIMVPRWMDVGIQGNQVDVDVSGTEGEIAVETVAGEVRIQGGRDVIHARSIQGSVRVENARGRVEAVSVNEEIILRDVEGDIYVETTNGDVTLEEIRSTRAQASTVNGDIRYDGSITGDGRYAFSTHNGDVSVTVPENAGITVSVSTFHGEFESDFPVRLTGTGRDREFTFTLGSGQAVLELESFNGEIRLRRP